MRSIRCSLPRGENERKFSRLSQGATRKIRGPVQHRLGETVAAAAAKCHHGFGNLRLPKRHGRPDFAVLGL